MALQDRDVKDTHAPSKPHDLQYCTSTQAGRQLDDHFELQIKAQMIYITTNSWTIQMSSPILSLRVT